MLTVLTNRQTISNNQISEDPTSVDDNEYNNEKGLHEEELYDKIIFFDETLDKAHTTNNNDTEHQNAPESIDES